MTIALARTNVIRPADQLGPVLTGRSVAEHLRRQIEAALEVEDAVIVDLDGVEAISPSFADELFAKLPGDALQSGRVRFEHLDDDTAALVRFVVAGRSG